MKGNKAVVKVIRPKTDSEPITAHMKSILEQLGEDTSREGLVQTPQRAAKALRYLTSGYEMDVESIVNGALFTHECDEMVIVRDIEFFSMCEHHLLPFFGKIHVGYLPNQKVIGLSKIPRIVDMFARRLQLQERLTQQVAQTLRDVLEPRGVEKQHSGTMTSSMLGAFRSRKETRDEFLSLVRKQQAW